MCIDPLVAEGVWLVISANWRINSNRLECEAWRGSRLVASCLSPNGVACLRDVKIASQLLRY